MISLFLLTALRFAVATETAVDVYSPLLSRLTLRACEDALTTTAESLLRNWALRRASVIHDQPGEIHFDVHGFRTYAPEAAGRRAFAVDEVLEKLGEQRSSVPGVSRVDAERWQLELGFEGDVLDGARGFVPTVLGDRLEFDVSEQRLLGGEFILGIHWEAPANPALVASLDSLVRQVHRQRAFADVPLRSLKARANGAAGEVYVLLDAEGAAEARFALTLRFLKAVATELRAWSDHYDARSG